MSLVLKFLSNYSFLIILSLINFSYLNLDLFAREKINNRSEITVNNINRSDTISGKDYLLGSGDVLKIDFVELEIFSGQFAVNADGFIYMPEINELYVTGLSLKELEDLLINSYTNIVKEPNIKASVIRYRPVKFYLTGEIKSPGLYTLDYLTRSTESSNFVNSPGNLYSSNFQNQYSSSFFNDGISNKPQIAPTLFDALKQGQGLTNFADLSNIKIIRNNSVSNGGGKIQTYIDLLAMIQFGDQSNNIRIMDGDSIIIPRNEFPLKEQILAIYKTNLNPDSVTVYITGNVDQKGPITIKKGSGLIQAIASSGGKKLLTGDVEFIRFNDDGTTKKNKFKYDQNAKLNTSNNPILMDGDVINVKRTLLGSTTEVLRELSMPLLSGFTIYELFND